MNFSLAPGPALALGPYRPGSEPPPGGPWAVVKVPRAVAGRARYAGAQMWTEDYGVVVCFIDATTGLGYAQPQE